MSKNFKRYIFIIFTFLISSKMLIAQIDFWERTGQEVHRNTWSLAVANNGNVWAGTDNGIYLSTNDGDSWVAKNDGLLIGTSIPQVRAIAISSTNGYIFAGTNAEGLFRSTDNGSSWTSILDQIMIRSIVITLSGEIYLGAIRRFTDDPDAGVYYSNDNGDTWVQKNNGLGTLLVQALALGLDGTLYAGTHGNGIFRSTDGGDNWSLSSYSNSDDIEAFTISGDGSIFATTYNTPGGVIKSTDRGNTWSRVINGLSDLRGTAILYNPITRHIFNATFHQGAFRTTDLGVSWYKINNGLPSLVNGNNAVRGFAVNSTSGRMYVGTVGSGVYRSRIFNTPILYTDVDTIEFTATYGGSLPDFKNFLVTNVGIGNLSWSAIESSEWFDITPTSGTNDGLVRISISTTTLNPGVHYDSIRIIAPNAGEESSPKNIVVKYTISVPIVINVVPEVIDFGSIPLGNPPENRTFTIRNIHTANISIDSTDFQIGGIDYEDFVFVPAGTFPAIIQPNRTSRTFTVRFSPRSIGEKQATLTINHNATGFSPAVIALRGNATKPLSPEIDIDPLELDFGDINVGSSKEEIVSITNYGTANLQISNISINGTGFTLVSAPASMNIAAGGNRTITVQFSPTVVGSHTGTVILTHNASSSPDTIILIGNGIPPATPSIIVDPNPLAFGDVTINYSDTKDITIQNSGTVDLVISQVSINGTGFTLQNVTTPITITAGESCPIAVQFSPTVVGSHTGTVILTHNASSSPDTIILIGNGIPPATPYITVVPDTLAFGDVAINSSDTMDITIRNTGTAPLEVVDVEINGTGFTLVSVPASMNIAAGGIRTIIVQFSPTVVGSHTGTVILTHNASSSPDTIILIGNGIPPATPSIIVDPDTLAFGDVTINSSDTKDIIIQNSGTADLVISQATINGTGFTLQNAETPITVPVGGGIHTIEVQFLPTVVGPHTGTIILTHNANSSPDTIQLTGRGVQANIKIEPAGIINFGDVNVGSSLQDTIRITNNGNIPLVISRVSKTGAGEFTLPNNEPTITVSPNGGNYDLVVQFLPTATGDYIGTLTLTHNADGLPRDTTIQLTGRGVQASIEISPTSINFGNVNVGSLSQQSVRIRNNGNVPLIVSPISISGNGFTIPNGEETITVQPDSSYDIYVRFLPTDTISYMDSLTLAHNADSSPSIIQLTGRGISSSITISPNNINFGDVNIGDSLQRYVNITNDGSADLVISLIELTGVYANLFTFTPAPPITIAPSDNTILTVQFLPTSVGIKSTELNINHNASAVAMVVPLTGKGVAPDITIDPTSINFGNVNVGTFSQQFAKITNKGTAPLVISSVSIDENVFTLPNNENESTITVQPDSSYDIYVRFSPTDSIIYNGTITLTHNMPDSLSTINLTGTGVPTSPNIIIDITNIDFGDVLVSTSSPRTFKITNNGNADLVISSIECNGADANLFTFIPASPITIIPSDSRDITVQFLPTSIGVKSAELSITHNGPATNSVVSLTGKGVEPGILLNPIDNDTINFGSVFVNTSSSNSYIAISNIGTAPLTITNLQIAGTDAPMFKRVSSLDSSSFRNITIAAGTSFVFTFNFTPSSSGVKNARVTFTHSLGTSGINLTGLGLESDISITPNPLDFGDVEVLNYKDSTVVITNTGNIDLRITKIETTGINASSFRHFSSPDSSEIEFTLIPSATYTATIRFMPDITGEKRATLRVLSDMGDVVTATLIGNGIGPEISVAPELNFDNVRVGRVKEDSIRINNTGKIPLNISSMRVIDTTYFELLSNIDSTTILPNNSIYVKVNFKPQSIGLKNSTLTINHDAIGGKTDVSLIGNGTLPEITLAPFSEIDFGNVSVGGFSEKSLQILNSGTDTLNISSIVITETGEKTFSLPNGENTIKLASGRDTNVIVRFSPTITGIRIATLNIVSDALTSPNTINLSGNGEDVIVPNVKVAIRGDYTVKPNGIVKISVDAIDTLTNKNAKYFSFTLKYNKRILSYKGVNSTLSNTLTPDTTGSTHGELVVKVTNSTGTPLVGTGTSKLIEFNFLGLIGDSCGTHLILESFKFNQDGPTPTIDNSSHGYCELFGRCGGVQTYVTSEPTSLSQNNPNPVREGYESTIQYRITIAGQTNLTVYDILGREVARLVNEYKSEGLYSVTFNTKGLTSGVYFYKLRTPGYEGFKKMLIIR